MTFITCEGLDGAGTTTLVEELEHQLDDVVTTAEPSNRMYGKMVRENLSSDTDPLIDFYLFMADRRDHITNHVKPAENNGKLVISDRYADSTRAYQPVALASEGGPFDSMWEAKLFIEQTFSYWNYEPDLTLYIDISVDTAIERSTGDEKYENRKFLTTVKDNYDALADSNKRIVRVSGEQSIDDMVGEAIDAINANI